VTGFHVVDYLYVSKNPSKSKLQSSLRQEAQIGAVHKTRRYGGRVQPDILRTRVEVYSSDSDFALFDVKNFGFFEIYGVLHGQGS